VGSGVFVVRLPGGNEITGRVGEKAKTLAVESLNGWGLHRGAGLAVKKRDPDTEQDKKKLYKKATWAGGTQG